MWETEQIGLIVVDIVASAVDVLAVESVADAAPCATVAVLDTPHSTWAMTLQKPEKGGSVCASVK
jgi:hypothetical protein